MSTATGTTTRAMGAWGTIWHQVKWELRRMMWWIAAATLVIAIPATFAVVDYWGESALLFTLSQWLLLVAIAVLVVQGDAPLSSAAFYRGRPLPWWSVPVGKAISVTLIIGIPSLLLGIAPLIASGLTPAAQWSHLTSIALAVLVLVALGLTWGAMGTSVLNVTVLVIVAMVLGTLSAYALTAAHLPVLPLMDPIGRLLMLLIAVDLYRRRWSTSKAAVVFLAVTIVTGALRGFGRPETRPSQSTTVRDSVRFTIDSVGLEQPHVARVAITVESERKIDLLQIDEQVFYSGGMSGTLTFLDVNEPSGVRVAELADSTKSLSFSLAAAPWTATLSRRGGRINGVRSADLFLDSTAADGTRRARLVAIVALLDSNLTVGATFTVQGQAIGTEAIKEGRLSAALPSRGQGNGARWTVGPSEPELGPQVQFRAPTADENRKWQMVRTSLGTLSERRDEISTSMRPHAVRKIGARRSALAFSGFQGSHTTWSAVVVPGLMRSKEKIELNIWPISANPSDSVDIYRLSALGRFGYRATKVISDVRGMRP